MKNKRSHRKKARNLTCVATHRCSLDRRLQPGKIKREADILIKSTARRQNTEELG